MTAPPTVLLAAFQGWNDAGESASGALSHLAALSDAEPLAELDPEDYYDFQMNRPVLRRPDPAPDDAPEVGAPGREIHWPTTMMLRGHLPGPQGGCNLVLIDGIEPNNRWRTFCSEIVSVAVEAEADIVILLGALLADVPHRAATPVTGISEDDAIGAGLQTAPPTYEGPIGVVGVLHEAMTQAGFPTVSFWAAVPYYAATPPCPKASLALLRQIEDVLDVPIGMDDLPDDAAAWERAVDEMVETDEEMAALVAELEQDQAEELIEASGETIAEEFERYLRRRRRPER